jgi:serine/threonine-protein kinase
MQIIPGFDPYIGAHIAGYKIEALVGRGGMSLVYRAEQEHLGRTVALKLLTPELARDERFRERFVSESRLAASLDHPNIIPIYDAGEAEGLLYIAMRFVEGCTLGEFIDRHGPLAPEVAIATIEQVGAALDVAHSAGLVHRDVKPDNILITEEHGRFDHIFLSDFGLTKRPNVIGTTQSGELMGTVGYVAPEQIESKPLDGRVDVYSLGCVLFQCLTGRRPFDMDSDVAILWAHLNRPVPKITEIRPELPRAMDAVIKKAMAKQPRARYETAGAFAHAARKAFAPIGVKEGPTEPLPSPSGKRGRRGLLVATGFLLLLFLAGAVVLKSRDHTTPGGPSRGSTRTDVAAAAGGAQKALPGKELLTAGPINRSSSSGLYKNPVVAYNAPDPSIISAGGMYYAYTTQSVYTHLVHLPVLVSRNLVEWHFLGDAVPKLPGWAEKTPSDSWGPDVVHINGAYRIYFALKSRRTGAMEIALAISRSPGGPFRVQKSPVLQVPGQNAVDPLVLEEPNGRLLLYSGSYNQPIRVQQLSKDGKRSLGSPQPVLAPSTETSYDDFVEGPDLVSHGGFYFLFYSGDNCCGDHAHYAELVARSRSPFGPFERAGSNPIVAANNYFYAPGHGSVFRDKSGAYFLLYHAMERSDPNGLRYLMLDRIDWHNGWPEVNGGKGPSHTPQVRPQVAI